MSQKQDLGGVRHTAVYKGNLLLARHEPEIDFASSIFLEFQAHISSFCSYILVHTAKKHSAYMLMEYLPSDLLLTIFHLWDIL